VEIQIVVIVFFTTFFVITIVQLFCHMKNHTCASATTIDISTIFCYSVFSHNCFSCTLSLLSQSLYLYKIAKYFNCMSRLIIFSVQPDG